MRLKGEDIVLSAAFFFFSKKIRNACKLNQKKKDH